MNSVRQRQILNDRLNKKPTQRSVNARVAKVAWFILFSCVVGATMLPAQIPGDFKIEAFSGSMAPWGMNQLLTIETNGDVSFYLSTVNESGIDSAFTTLDSITMVAVYDTVVAINFFALDPLYDLGAADGSGVVFRITSGGIVHTVEARNIAVPEINRLARYLNSVFASDTIRIKYGTINQ